MARRERSAQLSDEIAVRAAHIHSATAGLALLVAEFDDLRDWPRYGVRSPEHWLTITTGMDLWRGRELVRVGHAIQTLPVIREAFIAGELSFDKARAVTRVAVPEDEAEWLSLARTFSGNQLSRVCSAYGRAVDAASGDDNKSRNRRRSLRTWWREDGMLQVVGELPPAEGKLFLEALEAATAGPPPDDIVEESALDPLGAHRADALVQLVDRGLAAMKDERVPTATNRRLVVHVDFDLLVGLVDKGRCHVEDGPSIAVETARMIGCDADVVAVIEGRGGQVLDIRPPGRFLNVKQRRAVAARDRTCRYPGCGAPATDCTPHHIQFVSRGGKTITGNSVSLCAFHHGELHRGSFDIVELGRGELRFETPYGRPIQPPPKRVDPDVDGSEFLAALCRRNGIEISAVTPQATGMGGSFDLALAVGVRAENAALRRAGP
jgi:hypothetical protein